MAYDEDLANRLRELLADRTGVTEQKMFGGLAFMIGGNMAVAASGQGGILVRVDPAMSDQLIATTAVELMEMRGRSMAGWLRVGPDDLRMKRQLATWVKRGADQDTEEIDLHEVARREMVRRCRGRGRSGHTVPLSFQEGSERSLGHA